MDLRKLKTIIDLFENSQVSEMEIYEGDDKIRLCKHSDLAASTHHQIVEPAHTAPSPSPPATAEQPGASKRAVAVEKPEEEKKDTEELTSPMVGTFYRASSPEAEPYVHVGDKVRKGQTVCIIEAMKLMNEIAAPCDGEIVEIAVSNGSPVAFGDRLMVIHQ